MQPGHAFENCGVAVRRFVDLMRFLASCVYGLTIFERKSQNKYRPQTAPNSTKNDTHNDQTLRILAQGGGERGTRKSTKI